METRDGTRLWVVLLSGASAATTLALACATPFSALAAIAATRMPARAGVALMATAWAISQLVGFCVLDYPREPTTFAWGFAILTAAMAACLAARLGDRAVAGHGPAMRLATAYGTGFVGYKATLLAWSFVLGGVHVAASPYYTVRQFGREAIILTALVALYALLVRAGVSAAQRLRSA